MASENEGMAESGVWMVADGKLYWGEMKPDGNNTAHMQLQKFLPIDVIDKIECAGSVKSGDFRHYNSLFNNEEFRCFLNEMGSQAAKAVAATAAGDGDFDMASIQNAELFGEQRAELKAKFKDTSCEQQERERVERLWPSRIKINATQPLLAAEAALRAAIEANELQALKDAIGAHSETAGSSPVLREARALRERLSTEQYAAQHTADKEQREQARAERKAEHAAKLQGRT